MTPDEATAQAAFVMVCDALGVTGRESLAQAAWRVMRHNCADAAVLEVARRVAAMQGRTSFEQWRTVLACAEVLSAPVNPNPRPRPRKDATT